jgi:DNA polymerase (family 10)
VENNHRIAQMLRQIGALLDEQGVAFKPAAYRRAAQAIDGLAFDVTQQTKKDLLSIPGIGQAIAEKIEEFAKTGHMKALDDLLKTQGGLSGELMDIEGLGPKRVRQLQQIGITNRKQLIDAAKKGKLRDLERFSELMEKKILDYAEVSPERNKRYPLAEAKPYVEEVLSSIRELKGVERAEAAGSYRRQKETVGDIDILVVAKKPEDMISQVAELPLVQEIVARGPTKLSFNLPNLLRVDVRCLKANEWGSALLYFTGDKEHNIAMRKIAIKNGWKLSEYGLFEGEKVIASKTEEEIYKKLGLPWVEPKQRTGVLPR